MTALIHDKENSRYIYLGYDMKLSKTEYKILFYLCENSDRYVSARELASACCGAHGQSGGNVAAHVCHINHRSDVIGERHIIISKYGVGYKLATI